MRQRRELLNSKGMALLTVVLIFLVLVLLLGGIMQFSITNLDNSKTANKHTTIYYSAESGLNIMTEKLQQFMATADVTTPSTFQTALTNFMTSNNNYSLTTTSLGTSGTTLVTLTSQPDVVIGSKTYKDIRLTSTSTLSGTSRTLYRDYLYYYTTDKSLGAVLAKGSINIDQIDQLTGPIGSNTGPITIKQAQDCAYLTTVTIPQSPPNPAVTLPSCLSTYSVPVKTTPTPVVFPPVALPDYTGYTWLSKTSITSTNLTLNLSANPGTKTGFEISSFKPGTTNIVTINLGTWAGTDGFVDLKVTGDFSLPAKLVVQGTGRLRIQTVKNISITNFSLDPVDPMRFFLLTSGSVSFSKPCSFTGNLISTETTAIQLDTCTYYGYLITKTTSITFKSGGLMNEKPIVIYAPDGNVSFTVQSALLGSIIANTVYTKNGNTIIQYDGSLYNPTIDDLFWFDIPTVIGQNSVITQTNPIIEQ